MFSGARSIPAFPTPLRRVWSSLALVPVARANGFSGRPMGAVGPDLWLQQPTCGRPASRGGVLPITRCGEGRSCGRSACGDGRCWMRSLLFREQTQPSDTANSRMMRSSRCRRQVGHAYTEETITVRFDERPQRTMSKHPAALNRRVPLVGELRQANDTAGVQLIGIAPRRPVGYSCRLNRKDAMSAMRGSDAPRQTATLRPCFSICETSMKGDGP